MTQRQFNPHTSYGSNDVAGLGDTSSDPSLEWASAYLSHWFEECSMGSPRSMRHRSFHGQGSQHGLLHSPTRSSPSSSSYAPQQSRHRTFHGQDSQHSLLHSPTRSSPSSSSYAPQQSTRGHEDDREYAHISHSQSSINIDSSPSPRSPSRHKKLSQECRYMAAFPQLPFQPRQKMILQDFDLGDRGSPKDMIIEANSSKALQNIESLEKHDCAFVLRSCGTFTYAIVSDFPVERGIHASIRFVTDKKGRTKTLEAKQWAKFIRLLNTSNYTAISPKSRINAQSHYSQEKKLRKRVGKNTY